MNRAQSLSTWMPAPFVAFNSIEICSEFQGWARKENNPNNLKPGSSKQLNKSSWSFLVIVNKLPVNPSGRPWSRQMLTFVPISRNKLRGIILMCLKLQGLCTFQAMAHFQLVAHRVRTKSHLHHLVCLTPTQQCHTHCCCCGCSKPTAREANTLWLKSWHHWSREEFCN